MSVVKGNHAGSAGSDFYSYKINQSLRFDRASSTNLTRTAGSPSDGKKATWSWWMKKSDVVSDTSASYRTIFYSGSPNSDGFAIAFMRYGTDHYHELIVKQDNGSSAAHMFLYTNGTWGSVVPAWFSVVPAVLRTTPKLRNIYVFICKRHLKQRGSCVVQRGSSSVLKGRASSKKIIFCNTFNIHQGGGRAHGRSAESWFFKSINTNYFS